MSEPQSKPEGSEDVSLIAPPPRAPYAFLVVMSLVSLALDLGTKWWATTTLSAGGGGKRVGLIEGDVVNLALVYARNKGGAWGLLQNEHESVRLPFFIIISVAAVAFIISLYRKLQPGQTALKWGLPLVLGGALGNLVDRIRYRHVVDFIDAYYVSGGREHHWPTFNVADIAIVVGVGLMAIDMFQSRKAAKPPSEQVRSGDARPAGVPLEVDKDAALARSGHDADLRREPGAPSATGSTSSAEGTPEEARSVAADKLGAGEA